MLQGCRLPCRNRPFEFHPMAPWQDLGNSQTARHEARGGDPGYRATVLTIKPDQASQQTVCGFAGLRLPAKAGNAAWAIALRWPPPLWRRSGRAANRARICLARPAAPSGSAWLRMGPAIATLPFLFSRRKLRIVDGVVKSGAADPQGRIYNAAAGFFAARPGFLLVVGGRPCKTIGGAAKALGCKRRRAQAATYQPTLKERIWQAFEGWQAASIVM